MTLGHIPPQRKMYSVTKVPQTEALAKAAAKRQRKQDAKSR